MCGRENSSACSLQIALDPDLAFHMRLAGLFARAAGQFESDIVIEYNNSRANAKSIMGIIMLGIGEGEKFTISADGRDACEAIGMARDFFGSLMSEKTDGKLGKPLRSKGGIDEKAEQEIHAGETAEESKKNPVLQMASE